MSDYDDDDEKYEDDDVYKDDEDDEDDDEQQSTRGSGINPFTSSGIHPSSSNLPGRDRFGNPASPVRTPGTPAAPSSPISRGDLSARLGGGGNKPGGQTPSGSSPFTRGASGGGGDLRSGLGGGDKKDDDRDKGSSPFASGQRPYGSSTPGRFGGPGDKKDDEKRDTGTYRAASSSSSPFTSGQRSGGGFGGDKKDDEKRDTGTYRAASSGGFKRDDPGDRKKDDEKPGGGFGARLGGALPFGKKGDKEDDRKPASRPAASKGASTEGGGGIGAKLGGLTGALPFGKKGDDKPGGRPAAPKSDSGGRGSPLSAITGRFSRGGDKPATPKGTSGGGGGIGARLSGVLPFGKKDDDKPGAGTRPGGTSPGGGKPFTPAGSQSAFGQAKAGAAAHGKPDARAAAKTEAKGGILGRLTGALPFGRKDARAAAAKKQRTSKVPEVKKDEGLTLDNKLDILGVALLFGSMVLLFSALSPDKGALTGGINTAFGELLGWGAMGFPLAMLAVGIWLVVRHFGDQAPKIDLVRIWGVAMGYIGLLILFQYIESFNYKPDEVFSLETLEFRLRISYQLWHAGGGWVGAQLYYLLVANVTEMGGFFVLLGWFVVSIMFMTRTSASELAVMIISVWRSLQTSLRRRSERRRAAQLAAQQAAPPQISVAKPTPAELPTPAAAALPAPTAPPPVEQPVALPIEERNIPITMGGRTVKAPFGGSEPAKGETPPTSPASLPGGTPAQPAAFAAPPAEEKAPAGGLASRLRGSVPLLGRSTSPSTAPEEEPSTPVTTAPTAAPATGGIRGRLFGQRGTAPETPEKLADKPAVPSVPAASASAAQPATPAAKTTAEIKSPFTPATPAASAASPEPTARLGDLLKPATPASSFTASPFRRPPVIEPPEDEDEDDEEEETAAKPSPFAPKTPAASPFNRPFGDKPASPFSKPSFESLRPEDEIDDVEDEDDEEEQGDLLSKLAPARPKGAGPAPRSPISTSSPFKSSASGMPKSDDKDESLDDEDEDEETAPFEKAPAAPSSPFADRQDRLNAIRSGQLARPDGDGEKAAAPAEKPAASAAARIRPFGESSAEDKKPASPFPKPSERENGKEEADKPAAFTPPTQRFGTLPAAATPTATPKPPSPIPGVSAPKPAPTLNVPGAPTSPPGAVRAVAQSANPLPGMTPRKPRREWRLPQYNTLLSLGSDTDFDRQFLVDRARIIEETLQSFGAPGKVVEINTGPVITQFGVEPDYLVVRSGKKNRVKVSAIAQLDKDLQLALGAKSIRIEAPVPGKGFVGVEVPNEQASLVSLRDVMDSEEFKKIDSPLAIALGQSVDGAPVAADLSVMPHLLIAGTTGSGKSVCVNSIICCLLLRNTPDKLKFVMVDPKRVELTGYNGVPHLIAPVVVELERIVGVLKWVTREMDERYKRFSNAGARNIEDFNKHIPPGEELMPYIIVIIDELADLMMLAPDETERVITRIAALARATGIHLVIATQRPSVDVVTGLIKANFPARIAFAVAGSVDSRVILDQPGAERLLGRGDMLYMSGDSPAPVRLQGVFVSDTEINNIVRYWKTQDEDEGQQRPVPTMVLDKSAAPEPARPSAAPAARPVQQAAFWDKDSGDKDDSGIVDENNDGEDDMYEEAVELVRRLNKASVSLLQRRLRIGYTRAARLIDLMEERGVVGPAESGSKPREVLPLK